MTLLCALLILLGSQPLHAGAQACRKLRPLADRMRFAFPTSTPVHMNCGPGDLRSSNYVLPTDAESPYEMHVIGVYEGSYPPDGAGKWSEATARAVHVLVFKTRKPAIIVVSAHKPVLWNFIVNQDADLELVVLQGRGPQSVRGLPADVAVLRRTYEEACGHGYGWERHYNLRGGHFGRMIMSLRCATGLRETSFQGCMSGAVFKVPHYEQEPASYADRLREPPCPLPLRPDIPLARAGKPAQGAPALPPDDRPEAPSKTRAARRPPARRRERPAWLSMPEDRTPSVEEPRLPGTAKGGPGMAAWPPEPADRKPRTSGPRRQGLAGRELPEGALPRERRPSPEALQAPGKPAGAPERPVRADAEREPASRTAPEAGVKALHRDGEPEALRPPEGVPMRGDLSVRALAILLEGDGALLTHDAVPDLIEALEKGNTLLRWRAADALGMLVPPAERAVKPLMRALKDPNQRVRSSAALALGNIGPAAERATRLLNKALKDANADVRYSAKTALERIGTKKALEILRRHRRR
ncbi:MAG: HEAT repeat domain-containing protein [Elusimicrobiota bacterium]